MSFVHIMDKDGKFLTEAIMQECKKAFAQELGDLVKNGVLKIEFQEPVLVATHDSKILEIQSRIKIIPKESEYIEKICFENNGLREENYALTRDNSRLNSDVTNLKTMLEAFSNTNEKLHKKIAKQKAKS